MVLKEKVNKHPKSRLYGAEQLKWVWCWLVSGEGERGAVNGAGLGFILSRMLCLRGDEKDKRKSC